VSSARRTLETWAWAGCAIDACDVEVRADLYLAPRERILQEIALEQPDVDTVVVLAHDPGLHELVIDLAGSSPAAQDVRSKFPTSAVAVFDVHGPWTDVDRCSQLREIVIPRG
jgi:phosphohistidine phosphatase